MVSVLPTASDRARAWDQLADQIRGCQACPPLVAARTHVVVGAVPPTARLLIVGEAPGAAEDARGEPFVGRSGHLLDAALAAAGLPRPTVGLVNVLKCRPPGNRAPRRTEVDACRRWLDAQLQLVDPELIVVLGLTAASALLGSKARLADLRGRVHQVGGRRLLVSYHPAAALRGGPDGAAARALRADLAWAAALLHDAELLGKVE